MAATATQMDAEMKKRNGSRSQLKSPTPDRRAPSQAEQPSPVSNTRRDGMHSFTAAGNKFVIDSRYTPKTTLGRGAYGVVMYVCFFVYLI
jgi:hypothetical protein